MKFVVTSTNSMKVEAVKAALTKVLEGQVEFTVVGAKAESKVSEQPMTAEETRCGACNRIETCEEKGDYYVSIESGVDREFDNLYSFTFAAIANAGKTRFGFGTSSKFPVPDKIARQIIAGNVLGSVVHNADGLISGLTGGLKTRAELISEAVLAAIIPFHVFKTEMPKDVPEECVKYANDADVTQLDRNALADELRELDFKPVTNFFKKPEGTLEVTEVIHPGDNAEDIYANGVEAIRHGEVAVIIMCGGQGSRLGSPIPKGMVQLDIPSKSSLLEIQLRRVKKLNSLFARYNQSSKGIPVYILTSEETHSALAAYLMANRNFGVPYVRLFQQQLLPARHPDGRVAMRNKHKVLAAPNGNGSIYEAMETSGVLADMERLGVKYIECHPIDNVLARPADPFFIGQMMYEESDCAMKVLKKVSPSERIGTVAKINGKDIIIEYSEIPLEESAKHMYGSIAIHGFTLDLLKKAAKADLPFHIAKKMENTVGGKEEVHKFERFIFDVLDIAQHPIFVEVKREEEFAPVKNAPGSPTDSPETAKALLLAEHRRWAEAAGIKFEGEGEFEIRPETSYAGEGILESYPDMTFKLPFIL